ncbi:TPA: hypothetical protein N0F65_005093 [Lagenidium giganteum]|uniref:Uncharacterized protein n=1 Tax=Lagenidium giganteum TaxID=4803 RepID=A0AAV2Z947_9STRA|nr:TPA: hypothetical protein N0F65_005093 [Lagenidium giganteum]
MYALCWADRKPKMLISNRGTTHAERPSVQKQHKKIFIDGVVLGTETKTLEIP